MRLSNIIDCGILEIAFIDSRDGPHFLGVVLYSMQNLVPHLSLDAEIVEVAPMDSRDSLHFFKCGDDEWWTSWSMDLTQTTGVACGNRNASQIEPCFCSKLICMWTVNWMKTKLYKEI